MTDTSLDSSDSLLIITGSSEPYF